MLFCTRIFVDSVLPVEKLNSHRGAASSVGKNPSLSKSDREVSLNLGTEE